MSSLSRHQSLSRSDYVVLGLMALGAVLLIWFLFGRDQTPQPPATNPAVSVTKPIQLPSDSTPSVGALLPQNTQGLPLQKMEQIVEAYYRLDPTDIRANIQDRMRPLVSAKVFATLDTDVGMNSVQDRFRQDNKLIQLGKPDLSKLTVESADGTKNSLWVVVPVTTQLYSSTPDGKTADIYHSNTVGVRDQQMFHVYFQLARNKAGQFDIIGFGDARSSP